LLSAFGHYKIRMLAIPTQIPRLAQKACSFFGKKPFSFLLCRARHPQPYSPPTSSQTTPSMLDIDETIDAFRRGRLNFDCKRMVLTQHKEGGERFEGQGYIRQSLDGTLAFKMYVTEYRAEPLGHLTALWGVKAGEIHGDEMFHDLDAVGRDGTRWTATRIMPNPHWDMSDMSVLLDGQMQSITARLDMPQPRHYLRLHFFEEYEVPLHLVSETENHGNRSMVLDRAEFEACGSKVRGSQATRVR